MPRSRSRGLVSIIKAPTCWWARKTCPCFNNASTKVVLPWSTWAMMARLRMALFWQSVKSNHPTYNDNRKVRLLLKLHLFSEPNPKLNLGYLSSALGSFSGIVTHGQRLFEWTCQGRRPHELRNALGPLRAVVL